MNRGNDPGERAACPPPPERPRVDRRAVLRAGAAGSVLVIALPLACQQGESPPSGPVSGGSIADVPSGTLRVLDGVHAVIGRDAGGLYAMSAVCTHAGCLLSDGASAAAGLECGCHGSQFDSNGAVTRGPAGSPLQHYEVDLAADGSLTIHGEIPVAASARTPVT